MAVSKLISTSQLESSAIASGSEFKWALVSLSDKSKLALLGSGLHSLGYTIVSRGGTATALDNAGVSATTVEQLTSFPETFYGHVKTLCPCIHSGILA